MSRFETRDCFVRLIGAPSIPYFTLTCEIDLNMQNINLTSDFPTSASLEYYLESNHNQDVRNLCIVQINYGDNTTGPLIEALTFIALNEENFLTPIRFTKYQRNDMHRLIALAAVCYEEANGMDDDELNPSELLPPRDTPIHAMPNLEAVTSTKGLAAQHYHLRQRRLLAIPRTLPYHPDIVNLMRSSFMQPNTSSSGRLQNDNHGNASGSSSNNTNNDATPGPQTGISAANVANIARLNFNNGVEAVVNAMESPRDLSIVTHALFAFVSVYSRRLTGNAIRQTLNLHRGYSSQDVREEDHTGLSASAQRDAFFTFQRTAFALTSQHATASETDERSLFRGLAIIHSPVDILLFSEWQPHGQCLFEHACPFNFMLEHGAVPSRAQNPAGNPTVTSILPDLVRSYVEGPLNNDYVERVRALSLSPYPEVNQALFLATIQDFIPQLGRSLNRD
jgi:hypothetical protein